MRSGDDIALQAAENSILHRLWVAQRTTCQRWKHETCWVYSDN